MLCMRSKFVRTATFWSQRYIGRMKPSMTSLWNRLGVALAGKFVRGIKQEPCFVPGVKSTERGFRTTSFAFKPHYATENLSRPTTLKKLTSSQLDQYTEEGYVVVQNVLQKEEIQKVKDAMDELKEKARLMTESNGTFDLGPYHTEENPQLRRVVCPSTVSPVFDELQKHPTILDVVDDLIGPSFRYIPQDKLNLKPPGKGSGIPWHQDWAFFPHTNDSVLTVSVLIDDVDRANGCLQVIPKSHRGPLFDHFYEGMFANVITDPAFTPEGRVFLEAPAGSITVHHVRISHGSAENTSSRPRRVCCFIYNAMDAWPLLGVAGTDFKNFGPVDFDLYDSTRLRGDPCVCPRLKSVPVKLPVPLDDTSGVYSKRPLYTMPDS